MIHPTIFADNTTITPRDSSQEDLGNKCNDVLGKLFSWTISNKLTINCDSIFCLLINNEGNTDQFNTITINGHDLICKTEGKLLTIK